MGSSFKPYVLATAVKQGMNVKTSTLDGFNNLLDPAGHVAERVLRPPTQVGPPAVHGPQRQNR